MSDNQAIDVDEVRGGKPARKKAKGGGGAKPPVMLIAALGVAVVAVGFCAFLFLQLSGLRKHLEANGTMPVPGEEGAEAHAEAEGHGEESAEHADNYVIAAEHVMFDLGEFTTNTSDNKFVKMHMILDLDSFYDKSEWEVYEAMMEKYNEGVELYQNFQLGLDEEGNPKDKGEHAALPPDSPATGPEPAPKHGVEVVRASGGGRVEVLTAEGGSTGAEVVPAMHGAPKEAPPPEMPELPEKPRSLMEGRLMEEDSRIRDMIVDEIGRTLSEDFIRPSGKDLFKNNIRIKINDIIGEHYGKVNEVLLPSIVSS